MLIETVLGLFTGTVGTALTSFLSLKSQREKNKHEQAMVKLNTEAMMAESHMNIKITEAQVAGEIEKIEGEAYKMSIEHGNKQALDDKILAKLFESKWTYVFGVLLALMLGITDVLKHFLRPGMTMFMMGVVIFATYQSWQTLSAFGPAIPVEEAIEMYRTNILTSWYLAVSFSTWWFGDRRVAKYLYRLNDGNLRN